MDRLDHALISTQHKHKHYFKQKQHKQTETLIIILSKELKLMI